eukprot:841048-Amphidinium_carterae.1
MSLGRIPPRAPMSMTTRGAICYKKILSELHLKVREQKIRSESSVGCKNPAKRCIMILTTAVF